MSHNDIIPFYHQRSHSVPIGRACLNGDNEGVPCRSDASIAAATTVVPPGYPRIFDYKSKPSPLNFQQDHPTAIASSSEAPPTLIAHEGAGFSIPTLKPLTTAYSLGPPVTATPIVQTQQYFNNNNESPYFFLASKNILNLSDYNRKTGIESLKLDCKMDKGFFIDDLEQWTCYRRNYFQVTARCIIPSHADDVCYGLQLNDELPMQPVQKFYLRLSAFSSAATTWSGKDVTTAYLETHCMIKPVVITQMTALRDKGPQREPPMLAITPIANDLVAVTTRSSKGAFEADEEQAELKSSATFDRLQFKSATANNGKRKAAQQYFRLRVELVVELSDGSQHVVSECYSSPLIVRGRSPGHYGPEDKLLPYQQRSPTRQRRAKGAADKTHSPVKKDKKKEKKQSVEIDNTVHRAPDNRAPSSTSSIYHNTISTTTSSTCITSYNSTSVNTEAVSSVSAGRSLQAGSAISTLPPPLYMYTAPPMISSQQAPLSGSSNSNTSVLAMPSLTYGHYPPPIMSPQQQSSQHHAAMMNSAFNNNFHVRSQSANDCDAYHRYHNRPPLKYQSMLNNYHQQQHQRQQQQHQQEHQQQHQTIGHTTGFYHSYANTDTTGTVVENNSKANGQSSEQVFKNMRHWQQPHYNHSSTLSTASDNNGSNARELQQHPHHDRTDSSATFNSYLSTASNPYMNTTTTSTSSSGGNSSHYDSSNQNDNDHQRSSPRPVTPLPSHDNNNNNNNNNNSGLTEQEFKIEFRQEYPSAPYRQQYLHEQHTLTPLSDSREYYATSTAAVVPNTASTITTTATANSSPIQRE